MLCPGLVSITFRKLAPGQIVDLVKESGLAAIEWGADIHVPPGKIDLARRVREMTTAAGLQVSSYGSYYRVAEKNDSSFDQVLKSAVILGAPSIRIWAGRRGSADADPDYRHAVVGELTRLAELAGGEGITVSLEFHGHTLTDTIDSADRLFDALFSVNPANRGRIFSYWQPPVGAPVDEAKDTLRRTLPRLSNVHVFHWAGHGRQALSDGASAWQAYFERVRTTGRDHFALIEFVRDESLQAFAEDARTLKALVEARLSQ